MRLVKRGEGQNVWLAYTKWLEPATKQEVQRRVPGINLDDHSSVDSDAEKAE